MSKQLSLNLVSEPESRSITDSVSEQKTAKFRAIQRYLNNGERDTIACVNRYKAGNRNNYFYYRLSYRQGKKIKHVHIPGGNTKAELVQYRANKLQTMIDRGADLAELLAAIADFSKPSK
jgi:hypothetical protein